MLYKGETFNERKTELLRDLKKSREDLSLFQRCVKTFGRQWQETVDLEREYFQSILDKIIALKKWRNKEGISDDDQFGIQSQTS